MSLPGAGLIRRLAGWYAKEAHEVGLGQFQGIEDMLHLVELIPNSDIPIAGSVAIADAAGRNMAFIRNDHRTNVAVIIDQLYVQVNVAAGVNSPTLIWDTVLQGLVVAASTAFRAPRTIAQAALNPGTEMFSTNAGVPSAGQTIFWTELQPFQMFSWIQVTPAPGPADPHPLLVIPPGMNLVVDFGVTGQNCHCGFVGRERHISVG